MRRLSAPVPRRLNCRSDELVTPNTEQAVQERDAGLGTSAMIGGKGATTTGVLPGSEAAVLARIPCRGKGYLKGAWCSERKEFRKRRRWQPVKNKLPTDELQPSTNNVIPVAMCSNTSGAFGLGSSF